MNILEYAVRLSPKITEIVKGKLSLGARILQVGGMNRVFKKLFSVEKEERLLKTSQCYLSTTTGPIAGLLFISNKKVAFCSERSIKVSSSNGDVTRIHYKVILCSLLHIYLNNSLFNNERIMNLGPRWFCMTVKSVVYSYTSC